MSGQPVSLQRVLLVAGVFGAAGLAVSARAEEFSWQLSGGSSHREVADFDWDGWSVDATYYVNPIDDGMGPNSLASFLHPTTRVSASASGNDSDASNLIDEPTAYTLSGSYVLPGAKWYVGAQYSKADVDNDLAPSLVRSDPKGYGVHAGRYLGSRTTLELGIGTSEQRTETRPGCPIGASLCLGIPIVLETTTDSLSLDFMHVRQARSLTYLLQAGIRQSDFDFEFSGPLTPPVPLTSPREPVYVYSVAGELFPTSRLGVRLGYSRPDGPGANSESYDVAATWFFKPRVAVQVSLGRASIGNAPAPFDHSDSAALRFIGRL